MAATDDDSPSSLQAVDAVSLRYKQLREETQNYRHATRAAQAAQNKAASRRVWDVRLTVTETAEGAGELAGAVFVVSPRQGETGSLSGSAAAGPGTGMCKIGRSTGDDFKGAKGVSLSKDFSVSTWHGKVRLRARAAGARAARPASPPLPPRSPALRSRSSRPSSAPSTTPTCTPRMAAGTMASASTPTRPCRSRAATC